MWSRFKQRFSGEPEESPRLRLVVLAAMLVPLAALARTRPDLWPHVILAGLGLGLGHWYSYRYRRTPSQLVRLVMFAAIHVALGWMFIGLVTGGAVPQAQFAIFAQAITSFDLRTRSNLFNTLIHSLAILYVAATLSRTLELGLYLLLFAALALAAFFIASYESGLKAARLRPMSPSGPSTSLPPLTMMRFGVGFGAATMLVIVVVFLFTPRFANRPIVPPFSLNLPLSGGVSAEIINPGVPLVQINGWSNGASDYYYGFDTNLDLRYRGGLSDELVMYVRSPSRSYWRSHSYDEYDGVRWRQSDNSMVELESRGVYFELPAPLGSPQAEAIWAQISPDEGRRLADPGGPPRHLRELFGAGDNGASGWPQEQQIVQTFNIVRDQPNLIFAAYRPLEIFLSTERMSLDRGDGIRLPESLQAGMTYSVVSYRPDFEPDALRRLPPGPYPPDISGRYLQLPHNISDRVRQLAHNLTAPHHNNFDKIQALSDHLRTTYPYNFFPPPHPPGAEVVDTFLFEDQEGVCEQYVTALVVMARILGIPARLASGYGSGDYNPVTGYYEVRYSDAHSWAEVYFPDYGWAPFDPTPGWTPQPYPTPAQNWLFANDGQLFRQMTGLDLPVRAIAAGAASSLTFLGPLLAGAVVLVGLGLALVYFGRRLQRWWLASQRDRYSQADEAQSRRRVLKLYRQGLRLLRRRRYPPRQPWQTVTEYAAAVDELPALMQLSRLAEAAAYRPQAPDAEAIDAARTALARLQEEIKQQR